MTESLGLEDAGRFIALIQQKPFDYINWRQGLFEDASIEEISQKAMELRNKRAREANRAEFKKILDSVPARKPLPGYELE